MMNGRKHTLLNWSRHVYIEGHRLFDYGMWVDMDIFRAGSQWTFDAVRKYIELPNGKWNDKIIGEVPRDIFVVKVTIIDETRKHDTLLKSFIPEDAADDPRRTVDKPLRVLLAPTLLDMDFEGTMHVRHINSIGDKVREIALVGFCDDSRILYAKLEDHPLVVKRYSNHFALQPEPLFFSANTAEKEDYRQAQRDFLNAVTESITNPDIDVTEITERFIQHLRKRSGRGN